MYHLEDLEKNTFDLRSIFQDTLINKLNNLSPINCIKIREKSAHLLDELYIDLLKNLSIHYFLECGAHDAKTSLNISKDLNIKSIAIEANPETFKNITLKNKHEKVKLINKGLGERNDNLDFYIPKNDKFAMNSSFKLKIRNNNLINYTKYKVKVVKLDDIIEKNISQNSRIALWIDVEGLSDKVLLGTSKYLNNKSIECSIIKIELESKYLWKDQILDSDIINYLALKNFIPVFRDFEYENQYNIIFVKKNYLENIKKLISEYENKFINLHLSDLEIDKSLLEKIKLLKKKLSSIQFTPVKVLFNIFFTILGSKSSYLYLKNTNYGNKIISYINYYKKNN